MLQNRSRIDIVDNTGVKAVRGFWVRGGRRLNGVARVGDVRTAAVRSAQPDAKRKRGDVVHVLVLRTVAPCREAWGVRTQFESNAGRLVTWSTKKGEIGWVPVGTRLTGPVPRLLRASGLGQLVSRAPRVV